MDRMRKVKFSYSVSKSCLSKTVLYFKTLLFNVYLESKNVDMSFVDTNLIVTFLSNNFFKSFIITLKIK